MATVFIHTSSYLDNVSYTKGDNIVVVSGSTLTVRQSNAVAPTWMSSAYGTIKFTVNDTGSITPIVFHFSGTAATTPAPGGLRAFNAGVLSITGGWYTFPETGNGLPYQTATFYHDSFCPFVRVETASGSNSWLYYLNLDSTHFISGAGPREVLGTYFRQDVLPTNILTFGSRNIWIPTSRWSQDTVS